MDVGGSLHYCLIAAALWALSLSLFRGPIRESGPAAINFFKCLFGASIYWIVIALFKGTSGFGQPRDLFSLALSGLLGFTFGDLMLFLSVREGGVQRALVLFNTSPLITSLLAIPLLGEIPKPRLWIGMFMVLGAVLLVITDPARRSPQDGDSKAPSRHPWLATLAGFGAALGQAGGILLSKGPLQRMPVLEVSAIRLSAAIVGLIPVLLFFPMGPGLFSLKPARIPRLAAASVIGTAIALLFAAAGIRVLDAGISSALLATTPLFALPISVFFLKERIGFLGIAGTVLGVLGVFFLR